MDAEICYEEIFRIIKKNSLIKAGEIFPKSRTVFKTGKNIFQSKREKTFTFGDGFFSKSVIYFQSR